MKRVLAALAAASFVFAGLLARAAHPGHQSAGAGTTSSSSGSTDTGASSESQSSGDGFSIAPSNGALPQVQSAVS